MYQYRDVPGEVQFMVDPKTVSYPFFCTSEPKHENKGHKKQIWFLSGLLDFKPNR